jgi:predicted CXXCH cytochrome family protein
MAARRVTGLALAAAVATTAGCTAGRRHEILDIFFDGVPPPAEVAAPVPGAAPPAPSRKVPYGTHGPYAARMCQTCHESGATNALVAPADQLCSRCHDIALDKRYVHGPLASGGCLSCHDPHGSQYRYLLLSESDDFCLRCHEPAALSPIAEHGDLSQRCTTCHDAHMSDREHLLR